MKSIIILGGGGHAKVVTDAVVESGYEVAGFLDQNPEVERLLGHSRLGGANPSSLEGFMPDEVQLVNGFGFIGNSTLRKDQYIFWKQLGFTFLAVKHPGAVIAKSVLLEEGAQVMAGAVLQPGVSVGENAIINTRAVIDHDCKIGKHTHVATGAMLSGDVQVGEGAHIGTGAAIIQGIHIGNYSTVGAGSVVIRDVPDYTQVMGVPAHHQSRKI